jgi:tetratricopeptide (TPR) repeat protein
MNFQIIKKSSLRRCLFSLANSGRQYSTTTTNILGIPKHVNHQIKSTMRTCIGNAEAGQAIPCIQRLRALHDNMNYQHPQFYQETIALLLKNQQPQDEYETVLNFIQEHNLLMKESVWKAFINRLDPQLHEQQIRQLVELLVPKYTQQVVALLLQLIRTNRYFHSQIVYSTIIDTVRDHMVKLLSTDFNKIICEAIYQKQFEFSDQVIKDCKKLNIYFVIGCLARRLGAYLNVNEFDRAMKLYNRITGSGRKTLTPPLYSTLLETLRKQIYQHNTRKYIIEVVNHINTHKHNIVNIDTRFCNALFDACAVIPDVEGIYTWLNMILDKQIRDVSLDERLISVFLLAICRKGDNYLQALEILLSMEQKFSIRPDVSCFSVMICFSRSTEDMQIVLSELTKYSLQLDTILSNCFIRTLCSHSLPQSALNLYLQMTQSDHSQPNEYTYATLLNAGYEHPEIIDSILLDTTAKDLQIPQDFIYYFIHSSTLLRQIVMKKLMEESSDVLELHNRYPRLFSELMENVSPNQQILMKKILSKLNIVEY